MNRRSILVGGAAALPLAVAGTVAVAAAATIGDTELVRIGEEFEQDEIIHPSVAGQFENCNLLVRPQPAARTENRMKGEDGVNHSPPLAFPSLNEEPCHEN